MKFLTLILLSLLVKLVSSDMDFAYSAADLYHLIQTEQRLSKVLGNIENSLNGLAANLNMIKKTELLQSTDVILKNPLLSYQLVKRHGSDLKGMDNLLDNFTTKIAELVESYRKIRKYFTNPDATDIKNAMEAIIRLRQTYNLTVQELSNGKLGDKQVEGSLKEEDLVQIGLYAKQSGMNYNAKYFLQEALNKLKEDDLLPPPESKIKLISEAQNALNEIPVEKSRRRQDREDFRVLTEMDAIFATDSMENLNNAFEHLCQLHTVKKAPTSQLTCRLDKSSSLERWISPLKIEVFHQDPQIVVIYDVLSSKEIEEIESATFFKLKRSQINVYFNGSLKTEPSIIRTTSQTWIHDLGHPQFAYLTGRIEALTGYHLSGKYSAEDLQVASYRPGGHYSLHTDARHEDMLKNMLEPYDLKQGDRLVTFMIYLSDVDLGGNTVFPLLNVSVKPVKGSAIIWGNLNPDGSINRKTLHGACPVLYGIKNIATKWIRANDQMFTNHKCKAHKLQNHFEIY